jgi:hypothetical protein
LSGKFDEGRWSVLTALVPLGLIVGGFVDRRAYALRALTVAALVFGFVIGVGRSLKSGQDDLFPAIRFMGALQVVVAMGVGAGVVGLAQHVVRWADRRRHGVFLQAAMGAWIAAVVIAAAPAFATLHDRVRISTDWDTVYRAELAELMPAIAAARPGRIQNRGPENHWAMILPYIEVDRPQLVVYGGAALQSSPNFVCRPQAADLRRALVLCTPGGVGRRHRAGEDRALRAARARRRAGGGDHGTLPPGRGLRRCWRGGPDAACAISVAHAGHGGAGPPPDGDARAIRRGRSRIDADLDVRAPTTFVIRESWHPRWRATLDGAPIRLRRVSPDFLAVDAPPGHHHLTVRFVRPWWTWASWLLWPLCAIAAALVARRTRRARQA